MQRDVQCCMLYSQGKVRTKDVLRFEVQTEGPDCSIQAIMQVFQISNSRSCGGTRRPAGSENMTSCLAEGGGGLRRIVIFPGHVVVMAGPVAVIAKEVRKEICGNNKPSAKKYLPSWAPPQPLSQHSGVQLRGTSPHCGTYCSRQITEGCCSWGNKANALWGLLFCFNVVHLAKTLSPPAANTQFLRVPVCVSDFQRDKKLNLDCAAFPFVQKKKRKENCRRHLADLLVTAESLLAPPIR